MDFNFFYMSSIFLLIYLWIVWDSVCYFDVNLIKYLGKLIEYISCPDVKVDIEVNSKSYHYQEKVGFIEKLTARSNFTEVYEKNSRIK